MVNIIWVFMILIGIMVAFWNGKLEAVTQSALDSAKSAVELSIGLIGVYALWLGIMKIAEEAGLVEGISRRMRGVMRLLFPDIPARSNAIGSVTMNLVANMLGLGNAATPLGLKAMQDLQQINRQKDRATNAMCMFLVINTASVQIIPTTVIAIRSSAGSANPAEIVGTAFISTLGSAIVGIIAARILEKWY
jgi:spore maturation protein A